MNMAKSSKKAQPVKRDKDSGNYRAVPDGITELLESAKRTSARAVNTIRTAVYWEIGRQVVESMRADSGRRANAPLIGLTGCDCESKLNARAVVALIS
jgi:hypothetical protein